jgi:hypothetical protein
MRRCAYCGKEYPDDVVACAVDQTLLLADNPMETKPPTPTRQFFRWGPARAILLLCAALLGLAALLNVWLARRYADYSFAPSIGENRSRMIQGMWIGAFEDIAIAALCGIAWQLMKKRTSQTLMAGSVAIGFALCGTITRWAHWELVGRNDWFEPLILWPVLLYVIVYGYKEGKALR